jgi:hypothetical protein
VDRLAGSQSDEVGRALAGDLDDQGDGAVVGVGDRERDPFGPGAEPDDHELSGPSGLGDPSGPHA